jgi:hypothetical protein
MDEVISEDNVIIFENNGYSTGMVTLKSNDCFLLESGALFYAKQWI